MTETKLSGQMMNQALKDLRGCKIVKHSDRTTRGVPDMTFSWMDATNWIENKYLRKGEQLKKVCHFDQLIFCHELAVTTGGRCWVTVYQDDPKILTIWSPRHLSAHIWPRVVGQHEGRTCHLVAWDEPVNLYDMLNCNGSISVRGWDHRFVTKLIKDRVTRG